MVEKVNKLILEAEYKVTGTEISVSKLTDLKKATDAITTADLQKVEADKKVEQAANQLNKAIDTETKKQSELAKAITETGKAMNTIANTNSLKEAFTDTGVRDFTAELEKFKEAARSAQSLEELTQKVDEFVASLPQELQADVFKLLESEVAKLEKSLTNPIIRLRELKRLINTETDPVLIDAYRKEAAELDKQLRDTNQLVKQLGSDTFFADTVVEGAQQAVGAFTAFQGILALTTEDQEEFAKAAAKAQGALALLQGVQSVLTNLKKSDNIITRGQIILQQVYAKAVGTSTGAMKGFRVALAGLGIGLLIAGLAILIDQFLTVDEELNDFNDERERSNRISKSVNENLARETVSIENARFALQSANTTQADRVRIIQDLQKEYPNYFGNLNAETASYGEIEAKLNDLNRALILKFEIQAREEEIITLIQKRLKAQDVEKRAAEDAIRLQQESLANAKDVNAEQAKLQASLAGALGTGLSTQAKSESEEITATLNELFADIQARSSELSLLPSLDSGGKTGKEQAQGVLAGSIAALEAEINRYEQIRDDLTQAGSEASLEAQRNIDQKQKELAALKELYGQPIDVEVFTPGSLKALRKQVNDLNAILESVGVGPEQQDALQKLKEAEAALDSELKRLFGKEEQQAKQSNEVLFQEEERHQLAMQGIDGDSQQNLLKTQLTYAKERLKAMQESGTATEDELEKQANAVVEIEGELNKSLDEERKKEREARIKGITQVVLEVKNLADTLLQIEIDRYSRLAELQQERVNQAAEIAENGNAELLQLEEKRLADLNSKREAFVRRQQQLAQIQLVAESMLAIAKAAAEGGAAAPFTIAATLIALAAGLAQARAAAQSQSFRKGGVYEGQGGYTGYGPAGGVSTNLGNKPYEYHFKEHIMPDPVVRVGNNLKWLEKIRMERLDIGKLISQNKKGAHVIPVVHNVQGQPSFHFNMNSDGIISIIERDEKNRKRIKSKVK